MPLYAYVKKNGKNARKCISIDKMFAPFKKLRYIIQQSGQSFDLKLEVAFVRMRSENPTTIIIVK